MIFLKSKFVIYAIQNDFEPRMLVVINTQSFEIYQQYFSK